ncbi:MAG: ABC transporter permease [Oscillospiraceae bacterium]|nr:ABC transporter permease [Oscillospiraceae bacterium]
MLRVSESERRFLKVLSLFWVLFIIFSIICRLIAGEQWDSGFFCENYWYFLIGMSVLLALFFCLIAIRVHKGKVSYIYTVVESLHRYKFLLRQLVKRDFKTKYLRSVLGVLWSFFNPLLMMLVQYIVFSTLFKNTIPYFAAYLIVGNICFSFFNESCSLTLNSIVGNAGLITKVYMPKYIYPLSRTISSLVNLVISLVPMLIVCLITGVRFSLAVLASPYFFFCLFLFSLGVGMMLSCAMVYFRDTQFLWGILVTIWMYFTPVFYSIEIIPGTLRKIFELNPMYIFISSIRCCIMYKAMPLPGTFLKSALAAVLALVAGSLVFKKGQDKFILYL